MLSWIENLVSGTVVDINKKNIVSLVKKISIALKTILKSRLNYPPGDLFCFDGYKDIQDSYTIVSYITTCAIAIDGTNLTTSIHIKNVKQGILQRVRLDCNREIIARASKK